MGYHNGNWMSSDEPQFYASATENHLCSQDPVIATSALITVFVELGLLW